MPSIQSNPVRIIEAPPRSRPFLTKHSEIYQASSQRIATDLEAQITSVAPQAAVTAVTAVSTEETNPVVSIGGRLGIVSEMVRNMGTFMYTYTPEPGPLV